MAVVTICSDFGDPKIKSVSVSIVSPSICHEVMGLDAMILVYWMLSFKPTISLSFTFIKRLFSSSLSARRVVSPAYLRLLLFLLAILIPAVLHPAWHFTWCTLHIIQISRVTIHSLDILFPNFEPVHCSMSSSNSCFLNCKQVSLITLLSIIPSTGVRELVKPCPCSC